jgi:hypothetical protein
MQGRFVDGTFCGRTFCGRTFCRKDVLNERTFCGRTFCRSTLWQPSGKLAGQPNVLQRCLGILLRGQTSSEFIFSLFPIVYVLMTCLAWKNQLEG